MKRWLALAGGIVLFAVVAFSIERLYQARGIPLKTWQLSLQGKSRSITIPYVQRVQRPQWVELRARFSYQQADVLIIPRLFCRGLQIYLNGHQIYEAGDLTNKSGNVWMVPHMVPLHRRLLRPNNQLRVRLFIYHSFGFYVTPYLSRRQHVLGTVTALHFVAVDFYWVAVGATLIFGLLFLVLSLYPSTMRMAYLCIGMSFFFGALGILDFTYRETSGSAAMYLFSRKLSLTGSYLGIWLSLMGVEWFFFQRFRWGRWLGMVTVLATLGAWWMPDPFLLKSYTQKSSILIVINSFTVLWVVARKASPIVIVTWAFYGAALAHSILNFVFLHKSVYLFGYGLLVSDLGLALMLLEHYIHIHHQLNETTQKVITDPLTGAYNRLILKNLTLDKDDLVVMIDINNFKHLNDQYGHQKGDEILQYWVKLAKASLRQDDVIVRLGGDEFLLILRKLPIEQVDSILGRLQKSFQQHFASLPTSFSYGISPIKEDFQAALHLADELMYSMKRNR